MIQFMGSDEAIAILKWIRQKPFTRDELKAHLEAIDYYDPFAGASAQDPLTRIMNSIKRAGYATCKGRTWTPDEAIIDYGIKLYQRDHVQSAAESYAALAGKASKMVGGPVDVAAVDAGTELWGKMRRMSRQHA